MRGEEDDEMRSAVRVGIVQMTMAESRADSLRRAGQLVSDAALQGAKLVVLPELFPSRSEATATQDIHEMCPRLSPGRGSAAPTPTKSPTKSSPLQRSGETEETRAPRTRSSGAC
jgi:hypothetical protein